MSNLSAISDFLSVPVKLTGVAHTHELQAGREGGRAGRTSMSGLASTFLVKFFMPDGRTAVPNHGQSAGMG